MKPHRLTLEAFGPYVDSATIEFDELALDGIFLIHGPTGAGKTFLLDAMSFALYGEVSGARGKHTLRSDHADPRATPRVILEFSANAHRYVVERSPAHTVPKVHGDGETTKAASASLARLDGSKTVPIASSITEVNREAADLVGLDASQFRQVILLPQGRFEQVLRADSNAREALLKTLFDTVLFERVAEWLDAQAKVARDLVDDQQRALDVLRAAAAHEWRPFAGTEVEGVPEENGIDAPVPTPNDQPALDELVEQIGEVVGHARALVAEAERTKRATQNDKETTDTIAARWDRRCAARARQVELAARAEDIANDRKVFERTARAEQLRGSLETEEERRAALLGLSEVIAAHLVEAITIRHAGRHAGIALPPAVMSLDLVEIPKQSAITTSLTALASHRTTLEELARKSVEADAAHEASERAREIERAHREVAARATENANVRQTERSASLVALGTSTTARDQLPGLQLSAAAARDRADASTALVAARKQFVDAERSAAKTDHLLIAARKAALDLRQRYLDGIAATLAGALANHQPCPVCGSTEHPSPAIAAPDAVAKDEVDHSENAAERADNAAREAADAVALLAQTIATLEARAGAMADDPQAASDEAARASAALHSATVLAGRIENLEQRVAASDSLLADLATSIASANTDAATAHETATTADARASTIRAEVVQILGSATAQEALATVGELVGALEALALDVDQEAPLRAAHFAAVEHLQRELAISPFADAEDARGALREDDTRNELAHRLKQHDDDLLKQLGILEATDLADLPDERPDTGAAQTAVTQAEEAHTAAIVRQKGATDAQIELTRLGDEHRIADTMHVELCNRADLLSGIADRCMGRVAPKVSLQRWVLAAYLDDICRHANSRLEAMTAGRYKLLVLREGERGGAKAGLGLRVCDAFTGEEREVTTLSGGETFQASLALALGVADAVQAHAGGVHLDALFIDEGFGSLDPDNLQLAMDELDRLREGGRMVGVISHVGALRERIRTGIEVIATDRGSTVRVGELALP